MQDKRLYHTVAGKIEKLIDDGIFLPGSRLPAERELAKQFGVSRVTVREAEIALQAAGKIAIRSGSGVYVLEMLEQRKPELPNISAFELTEARALFESEAAALAAVQIDDTTLAKLEEYVNIMASTGPDDEEGEIADREFHRTIADASGNTVISHIIGSMWQMRTDIEPVKEAYKSVCSTDFGARAIEHTVILDALQAHDPSAARVAMRKHFTRLIEAMLDVSEERAIEDLREKTNKNRERYLRNSSL